jgi:hypothetical protein
MSQRSRLATFSIAACIAYTLAYYFDWPLFSYDLEQHSIRFLGGENPNGPSIMLYGWVITAVLIASIVAVLLPRGATSRLPPDLLWLVPLASAFAAILYELRWFI